MVAAENRHQIGTEIFNQMHILKNGVRGSHVPGFVCRLHLRGNRNDETSLPVGTGNVPAVDDMFHQTLGFELGQDKDAVDAAVDEVAQHEVDNPVFSAERHGRFGALIGQRSKTPAFSPGKDHGKYGCSHSNNLLG